MYFKTCLSPFLLSLWLLLGTFVGGYAQSSPSVLQACNTHVHYLNQSVQQGFLLSMRLLAYNKKAKNYLFLNTYQRRGYLQYAAAPLPLLNPAQTPDHPALNAKAQELHHLMREIAETEQALIDYLGADTYLEDDLQRGNRHLREFAQHLEALESRQLDYYRSIQQVYGSQSLPQPGAWERAAQNLQKALDGAEQVLGQSKAYTQNPALSLPQARELAATVASLKNQQTQILQGIPAVGGENPLCPHHQYARMILALERMTQLVEGLKEFRNTAYYHPPYNEILQSYNEAIQHYNRWVGLAPTGTVLLYRNYRAPIFHPKYPQEILPAAEELDYTLLTSMEGLPPVHLIFLVNVSQSMDYTTRLPLFKKSFRHTAGILRAEDRLSLVKYAGKPKAVLKAVSAKEAKAFDALKQLTPKGLLNNEDGWEAAYQLAQRSHKEGYHTRIILITDSFFQLPETTLSRLQAAAEQGIPTSVFDYGTNMDAGAQLSGIAQAGKGNYVKINPASADYYMLQEAKIPLR
ncbi:VWA domain-containing protein [Eisenibacter elegans]|uniref:VWA domain-containing protein n=1 Tax=Eisenibacter elegans TaxID=997 RepID=UPI0004164BDF|nr:VWA domain-containing protein [Eisenibacter elegans]